MAREAPLPDHVRADIQGFITTGYGHLRHAAYLFVQVYDGRRARRWLERLASHVTSAEPWPVSEGRTVKPSVAVNVAFSSEGLAALGLPPAVLCTFPPEFRDGIAHPERSRILGDTEASDPGQWEVGGPRTPPVHALLIVHAASEPELEIACQDHRALMDEAEGGVVELPGSMQLGYRPQDDYEPFGFHDGISQPPVAGLTGDGVPTGEFILGYPNHFAVVAPTPLVAPELDPGGLLPRSANPAHASASLRDLGVNGSFVVYRKLEQDVTGFWRFMQSEAMRMAGTADPAGAVALAARCVGRWPSGAPLVLAPESEAPELGGHDDFLYRADPDGLACPIGAHIRRVNPRDDLKPYSAAQSLSMSEAHRLLRRARVFGRQVVHPSLLSDVANGGGARTAVDPEDVGGARGIHFFCVNADIRRQFEFVQQTWCNNPRFGGLNDNKDPLIGDNDRADAPPSHMTIPRRPVRIRTAALPRFVTVRAGAYLFMPSLTALRFLAGPAHDRR
jgi:deferrochelatase/peroxidase EfeB